MVLTLPFQHHALLGSDFLVFVGLNLAGPLGASLLPVTYSEPFHGGGCEIQACVGQEPAGLAGFFSDAVGFPSESVI